MRVKAQGLGLRFVPMFSSSALLGPARMCAEQPSHADVHDLGLSLRFTVVRGSVMCDVGFRTRANRFTEQAAESPPQGTNKRTGLDRKATNCH